MEEQRSAKLFENAFSLYNFKGWWHSMLIGCEQRPASCF